MVELESDERTVAQVVVNDEKAGPRHVSVPAEPICQIAGRGR